TNPRAQPWQPHQSLQQSPLAEQYPSDFGGVWIEHEPVYRIIVAFKNAEARQTVRDTVAPSMRRFVQIKNVRHSVTELEQLIDRANAAIASLGIEYVSYYEHRGDNLVIEADLDTGIGAIRAALPQDLQSFIVVRKGNVPKKMQATGYQAGEGIYAGWWFSDSTADPAAYRCSFAFNARDNLNRQGILTAGHCPNTPRIFFTKTTADHWVSLTAPQAEWNAPNTKYDYQFHRTDGLATGPWVFYENGTGKIAFKGFTATDDFTKDGAKNVIAGYAANGYFKVVGTWGYYDQTVGQVMCKSGHSTGLTCGEITHGYYTWNGAKGFIETGKSAAYIYATAGDSGGAVFTQPTSTGTVKASGIIGGATIYDPTPASYPSGDEKPCLQTMEGVSPYNISDCKLIHMPIDYIDDQQLLTVEVGQ
ncbi:S1 family peptidase, partial [Erythrobacter donghaensis]